MTISLDEKDFHDLLSSALFLISLPTAYILLRVIAAPYGKHADTSTHKNISWGPTLNARLAWFLFESPNLALSIICFLHKDQSVFWNSSVNLILLLLFVIHYIHRCLIYPLRMSASSHRVNISVALSAFLFCCWNGYLQGRALCTFQMYPNEYSQTAYFRFGLFMFFVGFVINIHSDSILLHLRHDAKSTSNSYKIPDKGLFQYVTAANYLGEIIEWGGYALACQSRAALAFWVFVCANLIPRAHAHHLWYHRKFENYPKNRKIIIPFLW